MTDCLLLLHGSTTFSPPFTVYHVDSCGSSCYVVLFGLRIFLFHLFSLLKFCTFFYYFFFFGRGKWGRVDMVWLSDALVHGYDLALWFLGFFFFSHDTHSPIKINRPLNFEVWCNLWEIIRSATQTPQFGEGKEVRKIDQIIYCTWAG